MGIFYDKRRHYTNNLCFFYKSIFIYKSLLLNFLSVTIFPMFSKYDYICFKLEYDILDKKFQRIFIPVNFLSKASRGQRLKVYGITDVLGKKQLVIYTIPASLHWWMNLRHYSFVQVMQALKSSGIPYDTSVEQGAAAHTTNGNAEHLPNNENVPEHQNKVSWVQASKSRGDRHYRCMSNRKFIKIYCSMQGWGTGFGQKAGSGVLYLKRRERSGKIRTGSVALGLTGEVWHKVWKYKESFNNYLKYSFNRLFKVFLRLRYRAPDPVFGQNRILIPGSMTFYFLKYRAEIKSFKASFAS